MRKIGYVRVSSQDQNQERQIRQLNEIGIDIIYQEKVSGATINREQLQKMLNELQPGDIIYVTDLTRITVSVKILVPIFIILNVLKYPSKAIISFTRINFISYL